MNLDIYLSKFFKANFGIINSIVHTKLQTYFSFLILFLVFRAQVYAEADSPGDIVFKQLRIEDGLSQSTVSCMLQDREGYLWFGTANGLNRYDGYNFLVFVNDPSDTTSISGNGILSMCEDKDGYIWIGTSDGILNKYDRWNGTFTRYNITDEMRTQVDPEEAFYDFPLPFSRSSDRSITSIVQDKNGYLWVGTWGRGLVKFDVKNNKVEYFHYDLNKPNGFHSNRIRAIIPDDDGSVWVGTLGGGLYKLVPGVDRTVIIKYEHNGNPESLIDDKIFSLFRDSNGDFWIGTYTGEIDRLTKKNQQLPPDKARFERFEIQKDGANYLSESLITSFAQDRYGELWIGTYYNGLIRYNLKKKVFSFYRNDPNQPNSLSKNDVLSIMEDRSGTIWIGTHLGNGLDKIEHSSVKFNQLNKDLKNRNGLDDDVVWAIHGDDNSNLWIGTFKGGLNRWDRKTGKFTYYRKNIFDQYSISDNHIRAIIDDNSGGFWIGTYSGGLNRFNKTTGKFLHYGNIPGDSLSLGADQVQALMIDRAKNLWVGTFGGGLNKISAEDIAANHPRFKRYIHDSQNPFSISDNRVYALFEDKDSTIWIGTFGGGLDKFNPATEQFINYKNIPGDESSISDNRVMCIHEDDDGYLWVGTYGGGLQKFDKQKEKFIRFGKRNKMNSSVVYGIEADNHKNLWMSTDNGLFKLNARTGTFTQYDLHDGLQSLEFSGGAYFKSKSGEMFFGGINGLNYFYPDSVKDNMVIPSIVVSSIRVFNEPIKGEQNRIELSYLQNFFSFEFSALDYTNPQDNQYAYILEGFDKDWHYVDSRRRIANYINLSPGEYVFCVIGSNNDGIWNNDGARIHIIILPPFWERWWFIAGAALLITFIIFYVSTVGYRNLLAIEKIKSKLAADLHDNVGSGLTEISILSELTSHEIKNSSPETNKNLVLISDKARQLIDIMSDIVWMVNPKRDTFYHLLLRLKDSYADLLNSAGISFKTVNLEKINTLKLPMDYKQNLFLIFKEGINNAIKYSKCNKIILEANLNKDILELILRDDGTGFDIQKIKSGNGLLNMRSRARTIGGELVIDSSGEGTQIKFTGKILSLKKVVLPFLK
ncbi:MAG: histidine kinase [Bacteroidetes bacterium]|nr:histidine kinase [Bacteroidota bacterium]